MNLENDYTHTYSYVKNGKILTNSDNYKIKMIPKKREKDRCIIYWFNKQ